MIFRNGFVIKFDRQLIWMNIYEIDYNTLGGISDIVLYQLCQVNDTRERLDRIHQSCFPSILFFVLSLGPF